MQVHAIETRGKGIALQFEHPTIAGTTVGGWMNRADKIPVVSPMARSPRLSDNISNHPLSFACMLQLGVSLQVCLFRSLNYLQTATYRQLIDRMAIP